MATLAVKKADLAGPGIGDYTELEKILPSDYHSLLTPRETQKAIFAAKNYIEENLCKELNLMMVTVPLIVDVESGVNDLLDRDGSRTPIQFHITNDRDKHPVDAQVVQAATKWKRIALRQFDCKLGEGICTDMRAVRKDYFLDHDHSCYVDQWDWERVIRPEQRNLAFLKEVVGRIWKVLVGAEKFVQEHVSQAAATRAIPTCRRSSPSCTPKRSWRCSPTCRASSARRKCCRNIPPSSSSASGGRWRTGCRTRTAPPITTTGSRKPGVKPARDTHGLNGDILVWNHVTRRRHELTSMGIRVNAETLKQQLELSHLNEFLKFPYHQAIVRNEIPLSIGGGIGQARTLMTLLRKAHLGEVSVTVWPKILKDMCAKKNIFVLE